MPKYRAQLYAVTPDEPDITDTRDFGAPDREQAEAMTWEWVHAQPAFSSATHVRLKDDCGWFLDREVDAQGS